MPLYYLLSGLFFKQYGGFGNFTLRKINKILIPFLFFYVVSFGIYLGISHFLPGVRINSAVETFYFSDPIFSRLCVNNPIWFLLSLFTVNVIFYFMFKYVKNIYVIGVSMFLLAAFAYVLKIYEITLPIYLNKTFYYIPFFWMGYMLKRTDILVETGESTKDTKLGFAALLVFAVLVLLPLQSALDVARYYVAGFFGIIALLMLLKKIKHVPVVSNVYGRYSIIILCTSYWIYSPLSFVMARLLEGSIGEWYKVVVFVATMFIEYFVIKFCVKFMPHVTAQKDVIPVD